VEEAVWQHCSEIVAPPKVPLAANWPEPPTHLVAAEELFVVTGPLIASIAGNISNRTMIGSSLFGSSL
jgi:hypothetical protein